MKELKFYKKQPKSNHTYITSDLNVGKTISKNQLNEQNFGDIFS